MKKLSDHSNPTRNIIEPLLIKPGGKISVQLTAEENFMAQKFFYPMVFCHENAVEERTEKFIAYNTYASFILDRYGVTAKAKEYNLAIVSILFDFITEKVNIIFGDSFPLFKNKT